MVRTILAISLCAACASPSEQPDGAVTASDTLDAAAGDAAVGGIEFAVDVSVWETPLAQSQMDCYWDAGVRHVVVGTQNALIAQQQLAMAVSRGMTVDAYVYLYWDRDVVAQVEDAFAMTAGFPIGRMWLDIEEKPVGLSAAQLEGMIEQARAACAAHATCGIYTGPGWWKSYVANTPMFADVPLWYALYNQRRTLDDWPTEHFGGWTAPAAKQFQTGPFCGAGGTDWDTMTVYAAPTVTVDRTVPPDDHMPPAAPANLWPSTGTVLPIDYAKLMAGTVPRATQYQLALERYTGTAWAPYYTWTAAGAYIKVSPPATPALYRFRARAENAYGWGPWSDTASFDYGHYTGPRP